MGILELSKKVSPLKEKFAGVDQEKANKAVHTARARSQKTAVKVAANKAQEVEDERERVEKTATKAHSKELKERRNASLARRKK